MWPCKQRFNQMHDNYIQRRSLASTAISTEAGHREYHERRNFTPGESSRRFACMAAYGASKNESREQAQMLNGADRDGCAR